MVAALGTAGEDGSKREGVKEELPGENGSERERVIEGLLWKDR